MQKLTFRLLAMFAVLSALAVAGALHATLTAGTTQHLGKSDCAQCHLPGKNVTPQQASMLTASQEVLCGKCHPASIQVSHPSGFQPTTTPPQMYPLDWKGDLTCSTCHDIHSSGIGLMRGTKLGKELCLACHAAAFFNKMRDGGASLMAGHLASGIDSNAPTLDSYSQKCMECHGQSVTPKLATRVDRNGVVRHASQLGNHQIGTSYQDAASFGGYRARRTVERKLLLPEGKLSCVSCHSGYQKEHGKLVVTNARSALCYECHDI